MAQESDASREEGWRKHLRWMLPLVAFPMVAIYFIIWYCLKRGGLRAWSVEDFTKIVQAFLWHHTITIGVVLILVIFRRNLSRFLDDFIEAYYGDGKFGIKLRHANAALAASVVAQEAIKITNPDERLTVEFVKETMTNLSVVKRDSLYSCAQAHSELMRMGVTTKGKLTDLIGMTYIMDWLRDTYLEEFPKTRKAEAPLDPLAIATFGTILLNRGTDQNIRDQIKAILKRSPEGAENREAL